jgi:hypothetical protein
MDVLAPPNASTYSPGAGQTIYLPATAGNYEDMPFNIAVGDQLMFDVGSNQEQITVTAVSSATQTITATLTKSHQCVGVPITNVGGKTMLGNPGPQLDFDPRNPTYRGVVRYFSIIQ